MAEASKGIPWKGKAAQQGGSLAANDPNVPAASASGTTRGLRLPGPAAPPEPAAATAEPTAARPPRLPVPAAARAFPGRARPPLRVAPLAPQVARRLRPAPRPAVAAPAAAAARPAAPAAPPKPAGPPPVIEALRGLAPDLAFEMRHGYAEVTLAADRLVAAARLAKQEFGYDYLSAITAVDWQDRLEVLYHLYSLQPDAATPAAWFCACRCHATNIR